MHHFMARRAAQEGALKCALRPLIRIKTKAGHRAGKPTSKQIAEAADRWAFLVKNLQMSVESSLKSAPTPRTKTGPTGK